ncbi:NACHT domain-containing protein [Streptomyces davaonensis]|uniref:NACHT domain-containing protein n=1 Tax=Streptomyces davaonensis TaxID=348043 RepID=UPI0012FFCE75|nr:NACHT domain-containing protein [Streptomyces davaonensis]
MGNVQAGNLNTELAGVLSFGFSGIGLIVGATSLIISWHTYRADRAEHAASITPASIANELVSVLRTQWEAEARVRRLNDPYPLPVSWRPAEAGLVEDWELLCRQAVRAGSQPAMARTPAALAGTNAEITEVFTQRAPGQRLLVLGEPGAGKTMLLLTLLLGLLDQRQPGGPVPVIFPLASFNPTRQDLQAWIRERLEADYPGLRAPAPVPHSRASLAAVLLRERLVLPLLDGFDELPENLRPQALHAVNEALPPGHAFVLAGRSNEYRAALHPTIGVPVRLTGTAAIHLVPVTASVAAAYLERDAGGSGTASAERWRSVIAQLCIPDSTLAQVLATPLMLFLARTIYNPRPGETTVALPDPADLCDRQRVPSPSGLRAHLLDAFLPAAYRPHPRHPCPWDADRAQRAFTSLAAHLTDNLGGTTDIAWWQLRHATARWQHLLVTSVVTAGVALASPLLLLGVIAAGVVSKPSDFTLWSAWAIVTTGILEWLPLVPQALGIYECQTSCGLSDVEAALVVMSILAVLVNLAASFGVHRFPARRISWALSPRWLFLSLTLGTLAGGFAGVVDSDLAGTGWGATTMAAVLIFGTVRSAPADFSARPHPARLLTDDRRTALAVALLVCLSAFVIAPSIFVGATYLDGSSFDQPFYTLLVFGFLGGTIGLPVGVALALHHTAWGPYTVTRCHRARRWSLPFDTVAFLQDAHEHRGVLRQVGAVYQFRHLELQQRLAHHARTEGGLPASSG